MKRVRSTYKVPARRGRRVRLKRGFGPDEGREGVITSADSMRIYVRLDGDKKPQPFHPTWELEYLT